jgi:hypothetical protein
MKSRAGLIAIPLALLVATFARADTQPEVVTLKDFKKDLPKVAKKVLDIVAGEKQSVVAVGQFRGPAQHEANFGPGIGELLSQALEDLKKGVVVTKGAELSVQGSYAFVDEPTDRTRVLVKLKIEVINQQFERVKEFVAELTNNADIAKILGLTVSLATDPDDPKFEKPERNREIKLRLGDPKVTIDGPRIRAAAASKLAVEIRVKGEKDAGPSKPRDAKVVGGQAFVDIQRGEVYQVVIHNGGSRQVGVALTIDGLDAFTFSEVLNPKTKKHKYTHYVVDAGKSATIVGWHLRDQPPDNYSSFLVTEYGKGASARAGIASSKEDKIGVLTVAFSLTLPAGDSRGNGETGFGPPISVKVEPLHLDFEQPHEFVTVRYAR